jgi:bifunctional non-homologous end joining protein LigD
VNIGGRDLELKNLDKVFYPEDGFTKGDVLDYYIRIAPVLLPHLRGRPLTLKRYPDGVNGPHFYEKNCPSHRPSWVETVTVAGETKTTRYCVIDDLASLVWAVNLADLELHVSLSTAAALERPTCMVFDLDPGAPAGLLECARVALRLREALRRVGKECRVKTSGRKGLQVYLPLDGSADYEVTKAYARTLAQALERETPGEVTATMTKALRAGKVFIDWSQNDEHKTTVCVYSLRAAPRPTVSTPLEWSEVTNAVRAEDPVRLVFEAEAVIRRAERRGDLFAYALEGRQRLAPAPARAPRSRAGSRADRAAPRPAAAAGPRRRATTGRKRRSGRAAARRR